MKAIPASFLLGSTLALVACAPTGRGDDTGDDDGSGSGSGSNVEEPKKCNKMDIVFVVDDSGSMAEEQGNLATNFPMFADVLLNYVNPDGDHIDFRVAVTTTGRSLNYTIDFAGQSLPQSEQGDNGVFRNNCGVAKRWLDPSDTNNIGTTLACRANVGTSGPSYEMPLLMAKWALSERVTDGTNAGFLRDDALLGIVMLTDEDDSSTMADNFTISLNQEPPVDWHPQHEISFLDQLKGHRTRWAAGVIAGESSCSSSFGNAAEATRLKQFVQMANSGGTQQAVFSSICAGNLTTALNDTIAKFQAACGGIIL